MPNIKEDEWEQYVVNQPTDEWEQYATQEIPQPEQRIGGMFGQIPISQYQQGERNILGNIFERPAAAIRSGLMGTGYEAGAINPTNVPTFQDVALQKYYDRVGTGIPQQIGGLGVSTLGYAADIAINPAEMLSMYFGGKAIKAIAQTPVGATVGRFLTKPRKFFKFGRDAVLDTATKGVAGIDKLDDIAGKKYEKELMEIKGETSNLQPITDAIIETKATFPDEKFPMLTKVEDRLAKTKSLDAVELRNLKQEIKRIIPKGIFKGTVDATPQQVYQLRVYNAIDDALVELGGDKYIGMKKDYSDWKIIASDSYRALTERGRPSDVRLRNWFGYGLPRREFKALEKVSGMLPPKEQFMHDFLAWKRGQAAKVTAGGFGTYMLYRKFAGQK